MIKSCIFPHQEALWGIWIFLEHGKRTNLKHLASFSRLTVDSWTHSILNVRSVMARVLDRLSSRGYPTNNKLKIMEYNTWRATNASNSIVLIASRLMMGFNFALAAKESTAMTASQSKHVIIAAISDVGTAKVMYHVVKPPLYPVFHFSQWDARVNPAK